MFPITKQSYLSQGKQKRVLFSFLNMSSVAQTEMSPLKGMERTDKILKIKKNKTSQNGIREPQTVNKRYEDFFVCLK